MAEDIAALVQTMPILSRNKLRLTIFSDKLDERTIGWTVHILGPVVK